MSIGPGLGFIVMVNVVVLAHCPALGVNVYMVVAVLFNAGAHVPVMPFNEVTGNGVNAAPAQTGATVLNVGVMDVPAVVTVMLNVVLQFLLSFTVTVYGPAVRFKNILLV